MPAPGPTPIVNFRKMLRLYGGYSALARRLGLSLTTVHAWGRRGRVPMWRQEHIARVAKEDGKDVFRKTGPRRPRRQLH